MYVMSERLTREAYDEIEAMITRTDVTVPGEEEARELVELLIEHSRESTYKIELSARRLLTKNIEDLTVVEAEEYYEAIKTDIEGLQELMRERGKYISTPSAWEDELFRTYERCALALRVIGELSDDVIPQRLLDDYQRLLKAK